MNHIFLFEELTGKNKEETKIIYKDKQLVCIIPLSQKSSASYGINTRWCSTTMCGFKMWSGNSILFRFLFKDSTKIRMTYILKEQRFNWSDKSGNHFFDTKGKNPFELDISKYKYTEDSPSWEKESYSSANEIYSKVNSIPDECKEKVISYIEECINKNELPKYDQEQSTDYIPFKYKKNLEELDSLESKFKDEIIDYKKKGGKISMSYRDGNFKLSYIKEYGLNNNYLTTDKKYKSIVDLEKNLVQVLSE